MEIEQVKKVLEDLRNEGKNHFSSHDFIKKFAENYEHEYIAMLWEKRDTTHPFQIVHSQIGLDLERMQNCCDVHFTKDSRIYSENIFGKKDEVQSWILK
ncbi:MAG: hypothetical protein IJT90_06010 [Bacteroidaceae bacterium]|nr:hypothetical protein [Bacteroidaceae bacterium]